MFDNWINSDLIYINNILNKMGKSSQNLILDQLKYNINCISEFIYLKSNTLWMVSYITDSNLYQKHGKFSKR